MWQSLRPIEKAILLGFVAYAISGFLSYFNVDDTYEYVKQAGRYLRFVFIVPVALAILYSDFDFRKYLLAGIVLSGPANLYFALTSINANPGLPAQGYSPYYFW